MTQAGDSLTHIQLRNGESRKVSIPFFRLIYLKSQQDTSLHVMHTQKTPNDFNNVQFWSNSQCDFRLNGTWPWTSYMPSLECNSCYFSARWSRALPRETGIDELRRLVRWGGDDTSTLAKLTDSKVRYLHTFKVGYFFFTQVTTHKLTPI